MIEYSSLILGNKNRKTHAYVIFMYIVDE